MLSLLKILVFSFSSHAYLSLLTDGDILPRGQFRAGAETQFIFNKNDGINFAGHFDMPINESSEVLFHLGLGTTDFFAGGFYKYVPYPDFDKQPAIGVLLGATYASISSFSFLTLQLKPFVSKKFPTDIGDFSPYASVSFGYALTNDERSTNPIHLILGSKYQHYDWTNISVLGELGTSLSDAFNYMSFKFNYEFGRSRW